ncbi:protein-L-isoaspartate O-methyltransferase [Salinimicrobium marinum]|uniref:Protein-L-isoaspartate O-methyltransferase n=2 Tax=Salinimicrobium marinum TaxID=680283 RepID=A0A918S621_9FLAO|nr:protein-L-isoaspartate O-methyltransferase [Salinimicrobium marinum]
MVSQYLASRGISDKATLEAMRNVERHKMVPEAMREHAYEDRPLPIGNGQTISQPFMVAYMTQAIEPNPDMKVLEIGTGSGYQAAVLAEIVDKVYTIETVEDLAENARNKLNEMGYENIHFRIGDGYHGWEEHAPFDAIIVTAAPENIPPKLIEQLKTGGKMIIPVGPISSTQQLQLVEKRKDGKINTKNLFPVRFVPFTRRN